MCTGLTVILSDLFRVGDLVEISEQSGIVQGITMRFTILRNPLGAQVFSPNRSLSNIIVYPRGYVRCFADITLSAREDTAQQMLSRVNAITQGYFEQFPGIMRDNPEIGARSSTPAGRNFVRVKFRIWPGRTAPIEYACKQEIVQTLKTLDPAYAEWMVSINNEVNQAPAAIHRFRMLRAHKPSGNKHATKETSG